MLTFTVHEPPTPPADLIDRAERLAFVRDGFSWSAALFAPIWMLAHRLWLPFLGYVVVQVLIDQGRRSALLDPGWFMLATIALGFLIGLEASSLRRWGLRRRGWTTLGAVSGRNVEDCERRFFDVWLPTQPVLATPPADPGGGTGGRKSLSNALAGARG